MTCLLLAEDAYHRPVPAGGAVLNGAGECTGFLTAAEWGAAETPVYLTSTMQLGRVYDAACEIELEAARRGRRRRGDPGRRRVRRLLAQRLPPDARHRRRRTRGPRGGARLAAAAATPPDEGAVGAGTGMSCLGFKGGIGTASRITAEGHTVARAAAHQLRRPRGAGRRRRAASAGCCRRRRPRRRNRPARASGWSSPTRRSTARPAPGWPGGSGSGWRGPARSPTTAAARSSSAFGTGLRLDRDQRPDGVPADRPRRSTRCSPAVVEAAEEAVLNSMLTAPDHGRPRRQRQRVAALPRGPRAAGVGPVTARRRCGSRSATGSRSPPRCTSPTRRPGRSRACSRRCPTARTT